MTIVPALLCHTFEDFRSELARMEGIFDLAQIDVMDGVFVSSKSFPDIEKINELGTKIKFEVHLMVAHPLAEIDRWLEIKNLERIIFHIESEDAPDAVIAKIRGACKQVGIATNPETPLSAIEKYYDQIDEVLFMAVHPGAQGRKFVPEIKDKVVACAAAAPNLSIGIDGGIDADNIAEIKSWGVKIFCVGSALLGAPDINIAYQKLTENIK